MVLSSLFPFSVVSPTSFYCNSKSNPTIWFDDDIVYECSIEQSSIFGSELQLFVVSSVHTYVSIPVIEYLGLEAELAEDAFDEYNLFVGCQYDRSLTKFLPFFGWRFSGAFRQRPTQRHLDHAEFVSLRLPLRGLHPVDSIRRSSKFLSGKFLPWRFMNFRFVEKTY